MREVCRLRMLNLNKGTIQEIICHDASENKCHCFDGHNELELVITCHLIGAKMAMMI